MATKVKKEKNKVFKNRKRKKLFVNYQTISSLCLLIFSSAVGYRLWEEKKNKAFNY
jgi:hypothetical protein